MPIKVTPFPRPSSQTETPTRIIAQIGEDRFAFAVDIIVTEVKLEPAAVIPIQKKRPSNKRPSIVNRTRRTPRP
jgi:hypothetical protein